jgi:hypothetical protein
LGKDDVIHGAAAVTRKCIDANREFRQQSGSQFAAIEQACLERQFAARISAMNLDAAIYRIHDPVFAQPARGIKVALDVPVPAFIRSTLRQDFNRDIGRCRTRPLATAFLIRS